MLRKIILIVAILAGVAAAVLNFTLVKGKIDALTTDRNSQRDAKVQAQTELASTKKTLHATQAELAQTKLDLNVAEAARDQAQHDLAAATTKIQALNDDLAKTSQQRDDAQNQLASYKSIALTPV